MNFTKPFARFALAVWVVATAGAQTYRVDTVYGGGIPDNVPATSVRLESIPTLSLDPAGGVYFSTDHYDIFQVDTKGILHHIAGNGTPGFSGDGGPARNAQLLAYALGMVTDRSGSLIFSDSGRIR